MNRTIRLIKPGLFLLLFIWVLINRTDERQPGGVGSETIVLITGMTVSLVVTICLELLVPRHRRNAFILEIIVALIVALGFTALFHPDWSQWNQIYRYRNEVRWTGPFKNPNQFGLAMALGLVLTGTFFIFCRGMCLYIGLGKLEAGTHPGTTWLKGMQALLIPSTLVLGSGLFLIGLYKSYSRGAWLGALVGVIYLSLVAQRLRLAESNRERSARIPALERRSTWSRIFSRRWTILIISISLLIISFWCFRETNIPGIRRVFSVANPYDASWRNRVDAYAGSLQIIADHPWRGVGWGQFETLYSEYYMGERMTEGLAIVLNDYLTLALALGLPALCCFAGYIFITLGEKCDPAVTASADGEAIRRPPSITRTPLANIIARAGLIVLSVGFWFDRGLLLWHFGILFWLFLEFSSRRNSFALNEDYNWTQNDTNRETLAGTGDDVWSRMRLPCRLVCAIVPFFIVCCAAMLWAKARDPFQRVYFRLDSPNTKTINGIVVSSKPAALHPQVMYLYGAGSSMWESGRQLRLIAKYGFEATTFDYDRDNQSIFDAQFATVCRYLRNRNGHKTPVLWVTFGVGSQRALSFALSHPELQPDLLISFESALTSFETLPGTRPESASPPVTCPVLLVQEVSENNHAQAGYQKLDAARLASGTFISQCYLPESKPDSQIDSLWGLRAVLNLAAGRFLPPDYCENIPHSGISASDVRRFNTALWRAGENRRQICQAIAGIDEAHGSAAIRFVASLDDPELARITQSDLQRRYSSKWLLPRRITVWVIVLSIISLAVWSFRKKIHTVRQRSDPPRKWVWMPLRFIALLVSIVAIVLTWLNLWVPTLNADSFSFSIAEIFLLPSNAGDLRFLDEQQSGYKIKLGIFLQDVQLANLERNRFYNRLPNDLFQQYILSPNIDSKTPPWTLRKQFWEYFQARIRNQHDPMEVARIVVDCSSERVAIDPSRADDQDADAAWIETTASEAGFQRVYVAALRSVGIAARLNDLHQAELWTGQAWAAAPNRPALSFSPTAQVLDPVHKTWQ